MIIRNNIQRYVHPTLVANIFLMHSIQCLRKDNLGFTPNRNLHGVISTDQDGALFSVKAVVSKAFNLLKHNGSFINNTFDPTMSNKVSLQISNTPYSYGVSGKTNLGVFAKLVTQINPFYDKIINHLFSCYTCNSNKSLMIKS